jgi:hypothetical protein
VIDEITWDTFDERTRIWMHVLAEVPSEAVVRMLRLDLNTGVVTLRGVGGDKMLGLIAESEGLGRDVFTPFKIGGGDPIPYERDYTYTIALAVYRSALGVLVGSVPLVWDEYDGLCWITNRINEAFDGANSTDLREYRDEVRRFAAECWVVEFAMDMEDDIPLQVTRESTPNMIRFLTGGHGSVEVVVAPDDEGLIDVNILDPQGRGLCFHLAYKTPDVQEARDRAVLFLNNVIARKESHVG